MACYKLHGILSLEALLRELLQRVLTVPLLHMLPARTITKNKACLAVYVVVGAISL